MDQAPESTKVGDQLRRICVLCALGFTAFIVVLIGLETAGAVKTVVGSFFVLCPLALYVGIGLSSHAAGMSEFQIAGQRIPAIFAGMAAGAEWSAPIILLGTTSALLLSGYDGRWLLIGLTGGYVLVAVLVLPFLRNVGACSVPDFMTARFGRGVGLLAVVVLVACSLLFALALMQEAAAIVSRALGRNDDVALYVVLAAVLLCTLAGGMRALTAVQVAQYVALIIGCLALFVIFEVLKFDTLAGSTYDPIAAALEAIVRGFGLCAGAQPAQRLLWHTRSGEQPRADPLSHGGNGVAASHRDTRPDHAEHARGAHIGGLVTAVHCSAHLRAADLRRARECRIEPRAERRHIRAGGCHRPHRHAGDREQLDAHYCQFPGQRRLSAAVLAK